jgi:hypothetical protein
MWNFCSRELPSGVKNNNGSGRRRNGRSQKVEKENVLQKSFKGYKGKFETKSVNKKMKEYRNSQREGSPDSKLGISFASPKRTPSLADEMSDDKPGIQKLPKSGISNFTEKIKNSKNEAKSIQNTPLSLSEKKRSRKKNELEQIKKDILRNFGQEHIIEVFEQLDKEGQEKLEEDLELLELDLIDLVSFAF